VGRSRDDTLCVSTGKFNNKSIISLWIDWLNWGRISLKTVALNLSYFSLKILLNFISYDLMGRMIDVKNFGQQKPVTV
jgi:hypothetical protein